MTILLDDPRGGPDEPGILDFMEVCSQFYPADGGPITVERQRRCYDHLCAHFHAGRPKGMTVRDLTCSGPAGDIALRQYVPATPIGNGCVVYMHGGGFVLGKRILSPIGFLPLCAVNLVGMAWFQLKPN